MHPPTLHGGGNININKVINNRWIQRYGLLVSGFICMCSSSDAMMIMGMLMVLIWFVRACWMLMTRMTWFIGLPTFGEQLTLMKAVCEEKKRREDFENSLLEQQLQALNSAVANAASNQHTSS